MPDSPAERKLRAKKARLIKMLANEGRKRSFATVTPFPLNGAEPLRFSLPTESKRFHGQAGDTDSTIWDITVRQNGTFTLRLEVDESTLGSTYEASFEGLYKIEEHVPIVSDQRVTEYPTSFTSQGTVHLRFTLEARMFESRRTPWLPDASILQVEEINTGDDFKCSYRLDDLTGKNYFFRMNVSPACNPQDVHIVGPYRVPDRPRPHDLDNLEVEHMFAKSTAPLDIDTFLPEYIFADGRVPEEFCIPALRRNREACWAYPEVYINHVPTIGLMRTNKSPCFRGSLAPPDGSMRSPMRNVKSSPGLLLNWKTRHF